MRILHLDCGMGASGDMLLAALLEICEDPQALLEKLNHLGLDGVSVERHKAVKCGVCGTAVSVTVNGAEETSRDVNLADFPIHEHSGEHHHHHEPDSHGHRHEHAHTPEHEHTHGSMEDIRKIVEGMPVSGRVKKDALAVYGILAQAEAVVHGKPVEQVHFHEVGTLDAVADIVGVCLAMEAVGTDEITASPVHVGSGHVRCAHGILPVPAPAAEHILKGIPVYGGGIRGELCTPTGAALLKYFVSRFGQMPLMEIEKIGYGMGKKDFPAANCLRAQLGNSTEGETQRIVQMSCNLDDMTPEELGCAMEELLAQGALDVYFTPIQMKKNRPAVMLTCLCSMEDRERLAVAMLRHTSSFGVRMTECGRMILTPSCKTLSTELGNVRVKQGDGFGIHKEKYEYEDIRGLSQKNGIPLNEAYRLLRQGGK